MTKRIRTSLRLVVSIMLLSAVGLAATTTVDKNTNREHRSRFSKLAFWRGHKDHDKTGGNVAKTHQNRNQEHQSRVSKLAFWRHHKTGNSVKTVQANHASPKSAPEKVAQTKPAPHTMAAGKNGQKQGQSSGKVAAKTTSATSKGKAQKAADNHTTASLKQ